jgi:hypothetical protein
MDQNDRTVTGTPSGRRPRHAPNPSGVSLVLEFFDQKIHNPIFSLDTQPVATRVGLHILWTTWFCDQRSTEHAHAHAHAAGSTTPLGWTWG